MLLKVQINQVFTCESFAPGVNDDFGRLILIFPFFFKTLLSDLSEAAIVSSVIAELVTVCFQGKPGVPGSAGERGPHGEPVSISPCENWF